MMNVFALACAGELQLGLHTEPRPGLNASELCVLFELVAALYA